MGLLLSDVLVFLMGRYKIKTKDSSVGIIDKETKKAIVLVRSDKVALFDCTIIGSVGRILKKDVLSCQLSGVFDMRDIPRELFNRGLPVDVISKAVKELRDLESDLAEEVLLRLVGAVRL